MLLGPSLSGVDQARRSGGLIQTRRLTCEVASLDRAGGSAAPYLSPESAEEALPGPGAAQTAQQTQHLRLYSSLYCLMGNAAKQSLRSRPSALRPRTRGGGGGCASAAAAPAGGGGLRGRAVTLLPPGPAGQGLRGPCRNPEAAPLFIPTRRCRRWRDCGDSVGRGVLD